MKTNILLSAGLLFAAGCQQRMFKANADTASAEANIKNVKAENCEIFIDKAFMSEIRPDGGMRQTLKLFVKIDPSKLDGSVVQVAQYDKRVNSSSHGVDTREWLPTKLSSFAGSPDYFETELVLIDNGSWYKQSFFYEASFYVETEKGTRYWANAATNPNFETSGNNWVLSMNNLKGGALAELPVLTSAPDVGSVKKTRNNGTVGQFFNPKGCE